jgi:adenosine 3'-phospho 5'-phosphosulfate transporter B2
LTALTPLRHAQERIVTIGFGTQQEIFSHSIFLVLCNRIFTCSLALLYLFAARTAAAPAAPLRAYAAVSLTNVIATACQYEALQWVSFAVQVCSPQAPLLERSERSDCAPWPSARGFVARPSHCLLF